MARFLELDHSIHLIVFILANVIALDMSSGTGDPRSSLGNTVRCDVAYHIAPDPVTPWILLVVLLLLPWM